MFRSLTVITLYTIAPPLYINFLPEINKKYQFFVFFYKRIAGKEKIYNELKRPAIVKFNYKNIIIRVLTVSARNEIDMPHNDYVAIIVRGRTFWEIVRPLTINTRAVIKLHNYFYFYFIFIKLNI